MPVVDGAIRKFYFDCPEINIYDFWMGINIDELKGWIGRSETLSDWVAPTRLPRYLAPPSAMTGRAKFVRTRFFCFAIRR